MSSRSPRKPLSLKVMTAAVKGRAGSGGSWVTVSPAFTEPPFMTFANTPSRGMMQSPITL